MKILITGAGGQLGTELQRILARGRSELGGIPAAFEGASVTAIDLDKLDISSLADTRRFMVESKPDAVINSAAYTNVNGCEDNADAAFKANSIGPRNLAITCAETGAKLIHVSTDYVFPGDKPSPYREWDSCAPQSVYGFTKLDGEQNVRAFCPRHFIVRTAWLYGYTGGNFVKTILKVGRERGSLTVVDDQRGNPTNAADFAHHLLKLAASEEYGTYHCTGGGECSWYDFAREIVRLAGFECIVKPCSTSEYPSPAKRPANSSLDNMMLRCSVGDEMRHWKDALAEYMAHYNRENGEIDI